MTATERCPCGRMDKPAFAWLCRCCYLEKEIGYAISELEREPASDVDWPKYGLNRLRGLIGTTEASGTITTDGVA